MRNTPAKHTGSFGQTGSKASSDGRPLAVGGCVKTPTIHELVDGSSPERTLLKADRIFSSQRGGSHEKSRSASVEAPFLHSLTPKADLRSTYGRFVPQELPFRARGRSLP